MAEHLNPVEVDAAAELDAITLIGVESSAEAQVDQATAEAITHDPSAWSTFGDKVVDVLAGVVVPNWQLEASDKAEVSAAIAGVMDCYFPGAIQGASTWHPLAQLAFVLATVTAARGVDYSTLTLKPLRPTKASDNGNGESTGRHPPLPHGDEPVGKNGKSFTMGGG